VAEEKKRKVKVLTLQDEGPLTKNYNDQGNNDVPLLGPYSHTDLGFSKILLWTGTSRNSRSDGKIDGHESTGHSARYLSKDQYLRPIHSAYSLTWANPYKAWQFSFLSRFSVC